MLWQVKSSFGENRRRLFLVFVFFLMFLNDNFFQICISILQSISSKHVLGTVSWCVVFFSIIYSESKLIFLLEGYSVSSGSFASLEDTVCASLSLVLDKILFGNGSCIGYYLHGNGYCFFFFFCLFVFFCFCFFFPLW